MSDKMISNIFLTSVMRQDTTSKKIILFNSTFSLLCYIFLYIILTQTEYDIYVISTYSSWPILTMILIQETIKVSYKFLQGDTSKDLKIVKGKRIVKKVKLKDIFFSLIFLLIMFVTIFLMAVLLGAPFLDSYEQTFMFSTLIILLAIYPSIATVGTDAAITIMFGSKHVFNDYLCDMFRQNMFLTIFGAWCGAIVIPLDWDRPWQAWPIPCSVGALVGHFLSNGITLLIYILPACKVYIKKSRRV